MKCVYRILSITVAVFLAFAGLSGQEKPNFSGTWVAVSPEVAIGQEQTVKQTATTLTRGHASRGGGHAFTYKLDGTESRFVIHETVTVARASWEGDKLVIVERASFPDGRTRNAKFVWSISSQGELIVDFTEQFEGQPAKTMRITSKRRL